MPMIYLIRHGQTEVNLSQKMQGCRADARLTPLGEAQARRVGQILKRLFQGADAPGVVSSPMGRAQATSSIILDTLGLPRTAFGLDERIREIDYGDWTGLTNVEACERYKSQWQARADDPWNVPPPNGESYSEVASRATEWFRPRTTTSWPSRTASLAASFAEWFWDSTVTPFVPCPNPTTAFSASQPGRWNAIGSAPDLRSGTGRFGKSDNRQAAAKTKRCNADASGQHRMRDAGTLIRFLLPGA
jgi:broad specificity phosphatase PhoE